MKGISIMGKWKYKIKVLFAEMFKNGVTVPQKGTKARIVGRNSKYRGEIRLRERLFIFFVHSRSVFWGKK